MANGHGGYRQPAKPAAVSGPGKFAKRTDTGPKQSVSTVTGQDYGDAKQQAMEQRTAPMIAQQPLPSAPAPAGAPQDMHQMAPFGGASLQDHTGRPGEPITTGVPIGPGAGPEVLSGGAPAQMANGAMTQMLQGMSATDTTGALADLYQAARTRGL